MDVAGGHGLLGHAMLLLDDTSPEGWIVDPATPPSAASVGAALYAVWPRLEGRIHRAEMPLEAFALQPGDVLVSAHACGALTDRVLDAAANVAASVAVLPCCHELDEADGTFDGWIDRALAIDLQRARRLEERGYRIWTRAIPAAITPKHRLLIGVPRQA